MRVQAIAEMDVISQSLVRWKTQRELMRVVGARVDGAGWSARGNVSGNWSIWPPRFDHEAR
jgi:hypothetical protein